VTDPQRWTKSVLLHRTAEDMTEAALQRHVEALARSLGWWPWHARNPIGSVAGLPDLILIHPVHKVVAFRELKTMKGRLSPAQREVIAMLTKAGQDVAVWRPDDYLEGRIQQWLTRPAPPRKTDPNSSS
jgi:hypothetical protein